MNARELAVALACGRPGCPCRRGKVTHCPRHQDERPSLSVDDAADGLVLIHCHAGCPQEAVIEALRARGLWPGRVPTVERAAPGIDPVTWWEERTGVPWAIWQALGMEGRREGVAFVWASLPGVAKVRLMARKEFYWVPQEGPRPWFWPEAVSVPAEVWLVEGEAEAGILRHVGLAALSVTKGAGAPPPAEAFAELRQAGARLVRVLFDADPAGREGAEKAAAAARLAGLEALIIDPVDAGCRPALGLKDLRDVWLHLGRDSDRFREALEAAARTALRAGAGSDDDREGSGLGASQSCQPGRRSQATELIDLALGRLELWHTPSGEAFATTPDGTHLRLRDPAFTEWLCGLFYQEAGRAPNGEAVRVARETLAAEARFGGPEYPVFVRVGKAADAVYIDLGGPGPRAVEITAAGWRIVERPPVRFWRPSGLLPLPDPEPDPEGAALDELFGLFRLADPGDERRILWTGFLLACLHPDGPYPVGQVDGEAGAGKSTLCRFTVGLIDPKIAALRALPADERALAISARRSWLLAFNNISRIPDWLADPLCRLATDPGFSTRRLYSDDDEVVFEGRRPVLLNGVTDIVAEARRPDLADRLVRITLPGIPDEERRPEAELDALFLRLRPRILGYLYSRVALALAERGRLNPRRLPRLADVAVWVTASEPPEVRGQFVTTLFGLRGLDAEEALQADLVGRAVLEWVQGLQTGEAAVEPHELFRLLTDRVKGPDGSPPRGWPARVNEFGRRLRQLGVLLRRCGFVLEFGRRHGGRREVIFRKNNDAVVTVVTPRNLLSPEATFGDNNAGSGDNNRAGGDDKSPGVTTMTTGAPLFEEF